MNNNSLIKFLEEEGYKNICEINNTVVCTYDYLLTRGIIVGPTFTDVGRRYCYSDRTEADLALKKWKESFIDIHPPGNWVKLKGYLNGEYVDMLNPNWTTR